MMTLSLLAASKSYEVILLMGLTIVSLSSFFKVIDYIISNME